MWKILGNTKQTPSGYIYVGSASQHSTKLPNSDVEEGMTQIQVNHLRTSW